MPRPAVTVAAAIPFVLASLLALAGVAATAGPAHPGEPVVGVDGSTATHSPSVTGPSLHGNYVAVDPQVVGDGRVVVATAELMTDGYVAVHADDDGSRGAVLGHARLRVGTHTGVEVPIATDRMPAGENVTLRAALYADDGDGEFDAAEDQVLVSSGSLVEVAFPARRGEDPVRVVAGGHGGQSSTGSVALDRVELARPGHVVLREARGPDPAVVGHRTLDAGTHRNVTVGLDRAFFADGGERFDLRATVYADDGDGEFNDGDRPVRIAGEPVGTRLVVFRADDPGNGSTTTTAGGTGSTADGAGSTTGDGGRTISATGDGSPTGGDPADDPSGIPGLPLAGFGIVVAGVALLAYLLVRRR